MGYNSLDPFLDYPGDVVNAVLQVGDEVITGQDVVDLFGRPFMGGVDRHGAIAKGDKAALVAEVEGLLAAHPNATSLAQIAPSPVTQIWDIIRLAIDTAHNV